MNAKERKCALLMLLDRLDYERRGFDHEIRTKIGEAACQVLYRKSTVTFDVKNSYNIKHKFKAKDEGIGKERLIRSNNVLFRQLIKIMRN